TVSELGKNIGCIYQDKNDNYWFASNGEGVYRYDGKTLTRITNKHGLVGNFVWKIEEDVNEFGFNPPPPCMVSPVASAIKIPLLLINRLPFSSEIFACVSQKEIFLISVMIEYDVS